MSIINGLLGGATDLALFPFRTLPAAVGLGVISLLTAIGMLWVFRATSDQAALGRVKRAIHAGLFEIRLWNDDFRAILRAQRDILRHNATYLRLSLVPMLWIVGPILLLTIQLQFYYGYTGFEPGDRAVVKVALAGSEPGARPPIELDASAGVRVETPTVWIPSMNEAAWRIVVDRIGDHTLTVRVGDRAFTKQLRATSAVVRHSPRRPGNGLLEQLLYPAEPPLPANGPISTVTVSYAERRIRVLGWELHWMVVFFGLSLLFAFALRNRLGVTI